MKGTRGVRDRRRVVELNPEFVDGGSHTNQRKLTCTGPLARTTERICHILANKVLVLKPSITGAGFMKFSSFCFIYLVGFLPRSGENVSRLQVFIEQSYQERAETEIYFEDHQDRLCFHLVGYTQVFGNLEVQGWIFLLHLSSVPFDSIYSRHDLNYAYIWVT